MKQFFRFVLFSIAIFASILNATHLSAQVDTLDPIEGREHWFAIPDCQTAVSETVRWDDGSPILIWVSSRYNTTFTLQSSDGITVPAATYTVTPDAVTEVNLPQEIMLSPNDNERPTTKGIKIISQMPVTVGVFIAYRWSGEAFRVIPSDWLGKEYFTVNLWQDKVSMHDGNAPEFKPGEFVIVASSEGTTTINYTPRVRTKKVAPGQTETITLSQGQTYLIEAYTSESLSWATDRSDLSGSRIVGNKPFAVLSGHTKGTFPQYPATMYGIKTDFIRNMLMEMIWPVEHLGFDYISAPIMHRERIYANAVPNERGDLIRFVAAHPNTVITEAVYDNTEKRLVFVPISDTLQPGSFFDIPNRETPGYFVGNKKFLAAQFSKAWIDHLPPPKADNSPDEKPGDGDIQNPAKCGQGMMLILAPYQKWCNYSTFNMIPNMIENYVYLTFQTSEMPFILFDDQPLQQRLQDNYHIVPGTIFSTAVLAVAPGTHTVRSTQGAKFACYCYGAYDASKDGFAYGYPIGMNYAVSCPDSLVVTDTLIGDEIVGECRILNTVSQDTDCLGFWRIALSETDSSNISYRTLTELNDSTNVFKFAIKILDKERASKAKIQFRTKSGLGLKKEFSYSPEITSVENEPAPGITSIGVAVPNPASDKAMINYSVGNSVSNVTISLFDVLGNRVACLVDGPKAAGVYSIELDCVALALPAGQYFYKMTCGSYSKTVPFVVAR